MTAPDRTTCLSQFRKVCRLLKILVVIGRVVTLAGPTTSDFRLLYQMGLDDSKHLSVYIPSSVFRNIRRLHLKTALKIKSSAARVGLSRLEEQHDELEPTDECIERVYIFYYEKLLAYQFSPIT